MPVIPIKVLVSVLTRSDPTRKPLKVIRGFVEGGGRSRRPGSANRVLGLQGSCVVYSIILYITIVINTNVTIIITIYYYYYCYYYCYF